MWSSLASLFILFIPTSVFWINLVILRTRTKLASDWCYLSAYLTALFAAFTEGPILEKLLFRINQASLIDNLQEVVDGGELLLIPSFVAGGLWWFLMTASTPKTEESSSVD